MLTRLLLAPARVGGMLVLMAMSLLPLAALLLVVPAVLPQEAVLRDTVGRRRSLLADLFFRLAALVAGVVMFVVLFAFALELVQRLPLEPTLYFDGLMRSFLPAWLVARLPQTFVQFWPHVVLTVYATDLLFLAAIGKVPVRYNVRNLVVRWRITTLTAVAFTVVVGLLVVMLAFVNGMNELTEKSGIPGNVVILSEGALDEVFSNLGYGDVGLIERERVTLGPDNLPLPVPIGAAFRKNAAGATEYLCSRETFCIVNQPIPPPPGTDPQAAGPQKRRFVQVRGVVNPAVSGEVHDVQLVAGNWFGTGGSTRGGRQAYPCCVGVGIAKTLGADVGKPTLAVGDTFTLVDNVFEVTGLLGPEGSAYASEVWANQANVGELLGKKTLTTLVARVSDNSAASAAALAYHLRTRFKQQKLKAVTEPEYFADLSKTNKQFLYAIIVVAAIMAVGGVFGIMNTMFAAIAQRTKDIGVLRVIGYKRWQVLVCFMLESLGIAILGGALGCLLASFANGFTVQSILSSGQGGGGKTVVLRILVDQNMIIIGMLFTMVMGRLGGLLPALTAMRLGILESLR